MQQLQVSSWQKNNETIQKSCRRDWMSWLTRGVCESLILSSKDHDGCAVCTGSEWKEASEVHGKDVLFTAFFSLPGEISPDINVLYLTSYTFFLELHTFMTKNSTETWQNSTLPIIFPQNICALSHKTQWNFNSAKHSWSCHRQKCPLMSPGKQ